MPRDRKIINSLFGMQLHCILLAVQLLANKKYGRLFIQGL